MVIAAISANVQKRFDGFNNKMSSSPRIIQNRISNTDTFKKTNNVTFTSTAEAGEQAMVMLTEKAGTVFSALLIKARQFAAKRLGLIAKADIEKVEVDVADIKNAIDFFAKQAKEEIHVGYMSVLERQQKMGGRASDEAAKLLERKSSAGQTAATQIPPNPNKKRPIGFDSPIYKTGANGN